MLDLILSQFIALCTFFAFPIIKYLLIRSQLQNEANSELWYLSDYCFRLVVRGIPAKKTLSNIKYQTTIRKIIKPTPGCPVRTLVDDIVKRDDALFLFPGTDKMLLCFRIEKIDSIMYLVITDKLGIEIKRYDFSCFDYITCDYLVTVKNFFDFNLTIGKRLVIKKHDLIYYFNETINFIGEKKFEMHPKKVVV